MKRCWPSSPPVRVRRSPECSPTGSISPAPSPFFRWAGAVADADLLTLGTTGDAEAIKDTAVTQPLVVAMSLFIARELGGMPGPVGHTPHAGRDVVIAGHSVGELTAAALAGVLSIEAAIALTAVRGRAMAAACAQTPTGMSAVLGGDPDEVLAAIEKHGLTPANMNGAGQIVAAGALDGLDALKADPPAKARIMPLSVAGAFHTDYMASARERARGPDRRAAAGRAQPAAAVQRRRRRRRLRRRGAVAGWSARSPARCASTRAWPPCASSASPPSSSCRRPARWPGWPSASGRAPASRSWRLTGPADLDRARELIDAERGRAEAEHLPDWRVVVSPVRGTVSPAAVAEGTPPARRHPAGLHPQPPRGSQCLRRLRRGTGRVARPRGRPRRRRRPDRPSLPGGLRMTTIQLPTGAPGARILGLGAYRPRRRVTNDELAQMMDTNDEWIQSRVGIAERRWASEDETLVEMAVAAGGKAIAASGLAPDEIDLVIVASASLRAPIPGIGPQVAHQLGIPRPGAFDLNAGCAGFCYALGVADRQHPRRLVAQRAGGRRRAAHRRHRPRRPVDRGDLRRRRRCGRGGRRPTSRASARWPGAATATSTTPSRSPPAARR